METDRPIAWSYRGQRDELNAEDGEPDRDGDRGEQWWVQEEEAGVNKWGQGAAQGGTKKGKHSSRA